MCVCVCVCVCLLSSLIRLALSIIGEGPNISVRMADTLKAVEEADKELAIPAPADQGNK